MYWKIWCVGCGVLENIVRGIVPHTNETLRVPSRIVRWQEVSEARESRSEWFELPGGRRAALASHLGRQTSRQVGHMSRSAVYWKSGFGSEEQSPERMTILQATQSL